MCAGQLVNRHKWDSSYPSSIKKCSMYSPSCFIDSNMFLKGEICLKLLSFEQISYWTLRKFSMFYACTRTEMVLLNNAGICYIFFQ